MIVALQKKFYSIIGSLDHYSIIELFPGNLFLPESLPTTSLLNALINIYAACWFFLGSQPVLLLIFVSLFASLVSCFCLFLV